MKKSEYHTQKQVEALSYAVTGAAIEVHKHLGPGLLENVYELCLERELELLGLHAERQYPLPVAYKGEIIHDAFYLDLLVENTLIIELKSVKELTDVHYAQALNYLKISKLPKALLLNFNSINLTKASKPFVDKTFAQMPRE